MAATSTWQAAKIDSSLIRAKNQITYLSKGFSLSFLEPVSNWRHASEPKYHEHHEPFLHAALGHEIGNDHHRIKGLPPKRIDVLQQKPNLDNTADSQIWHERRGWGCRHGRHWLERLARKGVGLWSCVLHGSPCCSPLPVFVALAVRTLQLLRNLSRGGGRRGAGRRVVFVVFAVEVIRPHSVATRHGCGLEERLRNPSNESDAACPKNQHALRLGQVVPCARKHHSPYARRRFASRCFDPCHATACALESTRGSHQHKSQRSCSNNGFEQAGFQEEKHKEPSKCIHERGWHVLDSQKTLGIVNTRRLASRNFLSQPLRKIVHNLLHIWHPSRHPRHPTETTTPAFRSCDWSQISWF
mmetsp:Transcript_9459/g.16079  ORF Transcript_9459/g.16079 Transcript_9459/m.16079 type:complete len:357 (+) Transcript_9459:186-1256(+)